jgi:hypothetical protein
MTKKSSKPWRSMPTTDTPGCWPCDSLRKYLGHSKSSRVTLSTSSSSYSERSAAASWPASGIALASAPANIGSAATVVSNFLVFHSSMRQVTSSASGAFRPRQWRTNFALAWATSPVARWARAEKPRSIVYRSWARNSPRTM